MKRWTILLILFCAAISINAQSNAKVYAYEIKHKSGVAPVEEVSVNGEKEQSEKITEKPKEYLIYLTLPQKDKIFLRSLFVQNNRYTFDIEKISQLPVEWQLNKRQNKVLVPQEKTATKGWKIILQKNVSQKGINSKNELYFNVIINGKKQMLTVENIEVLETYGM